MKQEIPVTLDQLYRQQAARKARRRRFDIALGSAILVAFWAMFLLSFCAGDRPHELTQSTTSNPFHEAR